MNKDLQLHFSHEFDGVLQPFITAKLVILMPETLQQKVVCIAHYASIAEKQEWRKIFYYLPKRSKSRQ